MATPNRTRSSRLGTRGFYSPAEGPTSHSRAPALRDVERGRLVTRRPAPSPDIPATLAGMKKTGRTRRAGASVTIGVSVDAATREKLKALAVEKHHGNVSALITEMTEDAVRKAAFERVWQWYGGPEPTAKERAKIDAQLDEGWTLARGQAQAKKARRRKAA